jgi:hypothetical protein
VGGGGCDGGGGGGWVIIIGPKDGGCDINKLPPISVGKNWRIFKGSYIGVFWEAKWHSPASPCRWLDPSFLNAYDTVIGFPWRCYIRNKKFVY